MRDRELIWKREKTMVFSIDKYIEDKTWLKICAGQTKEACEAMGYKIDDDWLVEKEEE